MSSENLVVVRPDDASAPAVGPRRRLVVAAVVVAVVVGLWLYHRFDPATPHGNPDPGGVRLSSLERTARAAIPVGASSGPLVVHGYAWDPGGCDGGAAGWGRSEVQVQFRGTDVAAVDARMSALGWRSRPSKGIGGVRDWVPASGEPAGAQATLFADGSGWLLDLSAAPATVPTHAC